MTYYHSFAWSLYKAPLERVLKADPTCGMAHWARALALLDNPFLWPVNISPTTLAEGRAALEAAHNTGLKSQREKNYVEALGVFFKDHEKVDHRTRVQALQSALETLAQRYPDDTEAAVLHALVLSANFDPNDKTYANQLRAARILEPLFARHPEHPGIAHYLIHSYDYPPIARHGLEAAKRYARIAPAAAHAQHMPSHIFTRLGYWRESVDANRASAKVDADRTPNSVHAYDYMVYAHLQLGDERAAASVIAHAFGVANKPQNFGAAYAYAAMPARFALERRAWREAARLPLLPAADAFAWNKFPQAEAVNAYARGVGAAMSQDVPAAQIQLNRLRALRDAAAQTKLDYWADQIDVQAEIVRGLIACAEGRYEDGLTMLRKAADREDATEKHVVTPGPIWPAREALALMLLYLNQASDALRAFETVLEREPNRRLALDGAATAAQHAGDAERAKRYSAMARELTTGG
ncbi:MAG: hypothetical protein N3D71_00765 [Burkholderiaceae bacterium]|nr:hypothetical protein [Burkholderiaceae bacterium]